jgi:hypothetical protein
LLDSRWTLETVGIDATKKFWLEIHRVKGVGGLIVVGLDLAYTGVLVAGRRRRGFGAGNDCVERRITYPLGHLRVLVW